MAGISPRYEYVILMSTVYLVYSFSWVTYKDHRTMPKQRGPFRLKGKLDEISFYNDKIHGELVRRKGGPSKRQIKKSDSMEIVRNNDDEFGRASKRGALLRHAFTPLIFHCREYSMSRRLLSLITSLIRMDGSKQRGKRDLSKEHLVRLQEFELNEHLSYKKFFKKNVDIDVRKESVAATGKLSLPKSTGKKADFYKVVSVVASVDFTGNDYQTDVKESEMLACEGSRSFVFEHSPEMKNCVFYGLVVCFYKKNGQKIELITDDKLKAGFISFVD